MTTQRLLHALAFFLAFAAGLAAAPAAPVLRVHMLPETRDQWAQPFKGFFGFYIPMTDESKPRPPVVEKYQKLTVTVSGQASAVGGRFISPKPARLTCRLRGQTPAQTLTPYGELLRSWVGSSEGFSFQVEGLPPRTKYTVTFYACDFGSPENPRKGGSVIEDALNLSVPALKMEWDSATDVFSAASPLKQKAASLTSTSSAEGHLLFIITPAIPGTTALLNAFEIEQAR